MRYQPKHVQGLFSKSPETIRQWSLDFKAYLSADANPEQGHRRYNDDDLRVLAYVNVRKGEGATNEQISAELAQGQRFEPAKDITAIVAIDERSELILLQTQLSQSNQTIDNLRDDLQQARTRADRAEGALNHSEGLHRGEIDRMEKRLADSEKLIRDLYRDIARLEARQDDE